MSCLSSRVSPVFSSTEECLSLFPLQICPREVVQLPQSHSSAGWALVGTTPVLTKYPHSCSGVRARFTPCSTNAMPAISEANVCTKGKTITAVYNTCSFTGFCVLYLDRFLRVQMSSIILRAWYSCGGNPGLGESGLPWESVIRWDPEPFLMRV